MEDSIPVVVIGREQEAGERTAVVGGDCTASEEVAAVGYTAWEVGRSLEEEQVMY